MIYDVIIVGMGPAGVSAAIYAKRAGLKVLCFDKSMIGGELNFIDRIDNYAGLYGISGPDFAFNLFETVNKLGIEFKNKNVTKIEDGDIKKVYAKEEVYETKNVIIATGREPRELGLENEKELLGKGISRCALCDGAFYKGKDIAVVGGGNSAIQEALYLSNIVNKLYLIHRRDSFRAYEDLVTKINSKENVTKIMNANVIKLNKQNDALSSIELDNGETLEVSGLFAYIGFVPITYFVKDLGITDETGYIIVNKDFETAKKGIFAAGDIVKKDIYQISTAVSDGTIAASKIIENITSK